MDILWKSDPFALLEREKLDKKAIDAALVAERIKHPRTQLLRIAFNGWTVHAENKRDHLQVVNLSPGVVTRGGRKSAPQR